MAIDKIGMHRFVVHLKDKIVAFGSISSTRYQAPFLEYEQLRRASIRPPSRGQMCRNCGYKRCATSKPLEIHRREPTEDQREYNSSHKLVHFFLEVPGQYA